MTDADDRGARRPEDPERCRGCGNEYVLPTTPPRNAITLRRTDAATCLAVDDSGQLWVFHHGAEDEPDPSAGCDDPFVGLDTVTTCPPSAAAPPEAAERADEDGPG